MIMKNKIIWAIKPSCVARKKKIILCFLFIGMLMTIPCNLSNNGWKGEITPNQRYGPINFSQAVRCGGCCGDDIHLPKIMFSAGSDVHCSGMHFSHKKPDMGY
jgi:hypothetical protein